MMRSKYISQLQKEQQIRSSAPFLPMLCSSAAAKEVNVPSSRRRSSASSEEPSSPRVGCMGQVKRTNKVVAFPSTLLFKQSDIQNGSNFHNNSSSTVKYHKLKRFFSAKSLTSSPTITTAAQATTARTHKARVTSVNDVTVRSNRVRSETGVVDRHHHQHGRTLVCRSGKMDNEKTTTDKVSSVNLEELDPPLPVVKRLPLQKQQEGEQGNKEENMSLWKRRAGGAPLKTLQVQVVRQSHTLLPANTV